MSRTKVRVGLGLAAVMFGVGLAVPANASPTTAPVTTQAGVVTGDPWRGGGDWRGGDWRWRHCRWGDRWDWRCRHCPWDRWDHRWDRWDRWGHGGDFGWWDRWCRPRWWH